MNHLFTQFAFASILLSITLPLTVQAQDEVESAILALEKEALENWSNLNPAGYAIHFAENATYLDDIGAQDRVEGLENISNYLETLKAVLKVHKYEIQKPKFQVYDDMVIFSFHYHNYIPDMGAGTPWKASVIYREMDGNWKVVHANWSMIKKK